MMSMVPTPLFGGSALVLARFRLSFIYLSAKTAQGHKSALHDAISAKLLDTMCHLAAKCD